MKGGGRSTQLECKFILQWQTEFLCNIFTGVNCNVRKGIRKTRWLRPVPPLFLNSTLFITSFLEILTYAQFP